MKWPWQPKPMTAAAVTYVPNRNDRNPLRRRSWQDEAWYIWQNLGEAHYAVNFMARQLGRLRWDITENNQQLKEHDADEVIKLITQPEGTAEVARQIGVNWLVPGEVFYVQMPDTEQVGWKVVSPQHPDRKNILHDDVVAVHAWQPNPKRPQEPDSPMRAVLGVGNELLSLQSLSRAQTRSRLAQRGILLYPTGGFPEGTNFEDALEEAANAPIIDEKAPSAVTPLMVSFDGSEIPNWRYINLESEYDENIQDKIDRAIRRLSLGLDLPPEILLGVAELNHWSAWQVEESTYRAHLEPLAYEIAYIFEQAIELTTGRIVEVTPDPRDLLARRQTVRDAFDALDRGIVNTSYVREVIGADDEDAPSQDAAVDTVLRMVRTAPTLAQEPGIPELTRQIRELVETGEIIDEPEEGEVEGEGVREVGPPDDEGVSAAISPNYKVITAGNGNSDSEQELTDLADQLVRIDRELRARLYGAMETLYSLELAEDASVQQLTQVWAGAVEGGHQALNRFSIDTDSNRTEWDDAARSSLDLLAEGWRAYLQDNAQRAPEDVRELPTELIRDVVAVAGGSARATLASANANANGNGNGHGPLQKETIAGAAEPIPSVADPRGFAIGKLALEALSNNGIRWEQWRWNYGPSLRANPFIEHIILDGQFAGVMGEINGFYPGDHKGCLCDLVPVFRREVVH